MRFCFWTSMVSTLASLLFLAAGCKSFSETASEAAAETENKEAGSEVKGGPESYRAPLSSGEGLKSSSTGTVPESGGQSQLSSSTSSEASSVAPAPAAKGASTITSKVGRFIGGIAEGVTSTVTSVATSVGDVILGGPEKVNHVSAQHQEIHFLQLGTGGYRGKLKSDSAAFVMGDLESVMGFLNDAEFTHSQYVFGDWLDFDFSQYHIVAIAHRNKKRGYFLKIDRLLFNGSLVASGELYQEDPSCSLNEWVSSEVSFSLLRVPKTAKIAAGESQVALSVPERKACHGMLGSFMKSAQAEGIPFEKEWQGEVANPNQRLRIYRRTWGEWDQFTGAYCQNCRRLETRYGFPHHRLAIQITESGHGNIHVKKIFKQAGMYFIDIERDDCPVQVNSVLITVDKKDVENNSSLVDYSKILMTGPWIPRTKPCEQVL